VSSEQLKKHAGSARPASTLCAARAPGLHPHLCLALPSRLSLFLGPRFEITEMRLFILAIVGAFLAAPASADVLVLKNGDRITGKIKRIWDNEVTIEPDYADEFNVDLPIVDYIESDRDFEIDLQDGTSVVAEFDGAADDGDQLISTDVEALEIPLAEIFELDEPEAFYDWESHVDFSSNVSRGNTDTLNTQLSADIMFKHGDHRHNGDVSLSYEEANGVTTRDRDLFVYDYNYVFNDPWFFAAELSFERDPIIQLDSRTIISAGIGNDLIVTPRKELRAKLGFGYQTEEIDTGTTDSSVAIWALRYRQDFFGDDLSFIHNHSITHNLSGRTNTAYKTSTGFSYEITDLLYTTATVNYDYETEPVPPAGSENSSLVFGFGLEFE
jgi:putative salt-induced outer membrane protein YdiY